jgi:hypothetical protein
MARDVMLVFHGSIALVTPLTEPATIWVHQHFEHEESLYWCGALVVEPRYLGAPPIAAGMADDGLVIQAE